MTESISGRVADAGTGLSIKRVEACAPRTDDPAEIRTIHCDRRATLSGLSGHAAAKRR